MLASSENIITALTEILNAGEIPIILGGDHAIANKKEHRFDIVFGESGFRHGAAIVVSCPGMSNGKPAHTLNTKKPRRQNQRGFGDQ